MRVSVVARLAAALGKTRAAYQYDADEIAADATAIAKAGASARKAALCQQPIRQMAEAIQGVADRYCAELIVEGDPATMIFGLRFVDGSMLGMVSATVKVC